MLKKLATVVGLAMMATVPSFAFASPASAQCVTYEDHQLVTVDYNADHDDDYVVQVPLFTDANVFDCILTPTQQPIPTVLRPA